jgi:hypothetical protein
VLSLRHGIIVAVSMSCRMGRGSELFTVSKLIPLVFDVFGVGLGLRSFDLFFNIIVDIMINMQK